MLKSTGLMAILLIASGLAGCSNVACGDPHPYLSSGSRPPLQAPAGLTVPAPDPRYEIADAPQPRSNLTGKDATGACLVNPPQVVPKQPATTAKTQPVVQKAPPPSPPAQSTQTPSAVASPGGMV